MAAKDRSAAGTLPEIMQKIAELQAQAEAVRDKEKGNVIARMREAIEVYGITPGDLFGAEKATRGTAGRAAAAKKRGRPPLAAVTKPRGKKKRERRVFTPEHKADLRRQHRALVMQEGMTFDAAATKLGVVSSLLRNWYGAAGEELPRRAA